jgi:cell wall-associated NlpC family hydrolase
MPKRLVLVPVAVLAAAAAASAQPPIPQKQAQAAAVLAQINAIDVRLGHTVDAFDGAREQLAAIDRSVAANRAALQLARRNLKVARVRLAARLVALYTADEPSQLDVLLGSASLSDLIDRLSAANDVGAQDRRIAAQAAALQRGLGRRARALERGRAARRATVAKLASQRAEIARSLARRRVLLASIRDEIAKLRADQRAREAELARQARIRIARELAARRAAARAARKAATPVAPPPATAPAPAPAPGPSPEPTSTSAPLPVPAPVPSPVPAGGHPEAAAIAARYLGVPYRWGGASPAGFDCSGFVLYVYAQLGISLPHYTVAQYSAGTPVARDQLEPGDLVFFDGLGHVGIYIGGDQFIHAPHTGDVVKVSSLSESWYAATYVGARRI